MYYDVLRQHLTNLLHQVCPYWHGSSLKHMNNTLNYVTSAPSPPAVGFFFYLSLWHPLPWAVMRLVNFNVSHRFIIVMLFYVLAMLSPYHDALWFTFDRRPQRYHIYAFTANIVFHFHSNSVCWVSFFRQFNRSFSPQLVFPLRGVVMLACTVLWSSVNLLPASTLLSPLWHTLLACCILYGNFLFYFFVIVSTNMVDM